MPWLNAKSVAPWATRRFGGTRFRSNGLVVRSSIIRARDMGFLISVTTLECFHEESNSELTSNRADSTTASEMIHDYSVALNYAVHREVAPIAGVRDFAVLEYFDRNLYRIYGGSSIAKDCHGGLRSTVVFGLVKDGSETGSRVPFGSI